ncbi:MAG TPA: DUF2142 domain-containing protein [Acidisoma sp.]|uniref:DUF2142 domain-containing protein n=1 Tax=Acidisoma sp. TaxID=1872115 RepID=UPI002CCA82C8|nr:DUF2142 domain-containing protein [Acidisoma sp.]HTI02224.1 DUF2142 domain-containing protein [Acidisoma sp.]
MRTDRAWDAWNDPERHFFPPEAAHPTPRPVVRIGAASVKSARRISLLIFLCLVLPLGIILALVTPPGGVADEAAHALRAESLGHGEIAGHRATIRLPNGRVAAAAGVEADPGLLDAMAVTGPGQWVTPARLRAARAAQWRGQRSFAEITPLALYLPIFYLPSAIAMRVIELLQGGPSAAVLAGRMINLFTYALLGFAALRTARSGHGLLLCTLALPMEVSLAASLNQDGLLIASTVLALALLTRADGPAPWRGTAARPVPTPWLLALLLLGFTALAKLPYASLLLLPVLPIEIRRACLLRTALATLVALPALAWTGFAMWHISVPWPPLPPYHAGPLWPGPGSRIFFSPDPLAQLQVLLAAPSRIVTLTLQSILPDHALLLQFIGVLGFLSLRLPGWVYALWALALAAGFALDRLHPAPPPARLRAPDAIAVLFALAIAVVAIYISQYLTWTRVGETRVQGPSGRYFLPLLPALVLLCPGGIATRHATVLRGACFLLIAAAALGSLVAVPLCILDGFYAP